MKTKIIYDNDAFYTDAPPEVEKELARAKIIEDFLPPPNELVFLDWEELTTNCGNLKVKKETQII